MMNKTTCILIIFLSLFSACTEKLICPAYQSSFILDNNFREKAFSPFEVLNGDTIPKGDFDKQRQRSEFFVAKVWIRPERPVLENPYLLARVFNKRPYWKLDVLEPEIIYYNNTDTIRYESGVINDSIETVIPFEYVLTLPVRYPPYNIEQEKYNKKFGHLFPKPPKRREVIIEAESIEEFMADTLVIDSVSRKKGVLGIFKKKDKNKKPKKEKKKNRKENNTEGTNPI